MSRHPENSLSTFHRHRNVFHPAAHFHLLGSITLLAMHRLQLNASWSGAFMLLTFSSSTSNICSMYTATCSGPYAAASTTAKMALWCLAASASGHVLVDLWRRYTSHPHSRSLWVHLCIFKNICTCHLNHSSLDGIISLRFRLSDEISVTSTISPLSSDSEDSQHVRSLACCFSG